MERPLSPLDALALARPQGHDLARILARLGDPCVISPRLVLTAQRGCTTCPFKWTTQICGMCSLSSAAHRAVSMPTTTSPSRLRSLGASGHSAASGTRIFRCAVRTECSELTRSGLRALRIVVLAAHLAQTFRQMLEYARLWALDRSQADFDGDTSVEPIWRDPE